MDDDPEHGWQVGWKLSQQGRNRSEASRRGADHDHVANDSLWVELVFKHSQSFGYEQKWPRSENGSLARVVGGRNLDPYKESHVQPAASAASSVYSRNRDSEGSP